MSERKELIELITLKILSKSNDNDKSFYCFIFALSCVFFIVLIYMNKKDKYKHNQDLLYRYYLNNIIQKNKFNQRNLIGY